MGLGEISINDTSITNCTFSIKHPISAEHQHLIVVNKNYLNNLKIAKGSRYGMKPKFSEVWTLYIVKNFFEKYSKGKLYIGCMSSCFYLVVSQPI